MARPLKKGARLTMRVPVELKKEIQDEAQAAGEDLTAAAERVMRLGLAGAKHVRKLAQGAAGEAQGAAA